MIKTLISAPVQTGMAKEMGNGPVNTKVDVNMPELRMAPGRRARQAGDLARLGRHQRPARGLDQALEPRGGALSCIGGLAFLSLRSALTQALRHSHVAVDGLSLGVEKGEFVSLLGPSGCGKTTTLQMIAGFVEPSGGAIRLEGRDLLAVKPAKRGLGIVFQSYALFPHMTVAENVAFGLEMQGVAAAERTRRVGETLELVGLAALRRPLPAPALGRPAAARGACPRAGHPAADPAARRAAVSNLDAKLREEMQIELRQIQRTVGTTTILVTHDQAEAMALSDRIVVMNHGRAEQIGPPHEAYERPATPFVAGFLGKTNLLDGATVRPEKISFAADRPRRHGPHAHLPGQPLALPDRDADGLVTVIRQNTGEAMPAEGEAVHLAWGTACHSRGRCRAVDGGACALA